MSTSDNKIRSEEVEKAAEKKDHGKKTAEELLAEKKAETDAMLEKGTEKISEKISEEDVGKMEDEIDLDDEEHHEDGPYGDGETPTPPAEESDSEAAVEETSKDEEVLAKEEIVESTDTEEPATEKAEPEAEREKDPVPEEGEEHEVFCNRYMNNPNILRKITPSYRRAAAEVIWKQHHA